MFNRKRTAPKDPNAIEPTKLNSSKVIVNLRSGNSKKVTKAMLAGFKTKPYDKSIYMVFDSGLEARYYCEVLLPQIEMGKIVVRFQPKFEILKKQEKSGTKHMAVTYTPDFGITPIASQSYEQEYFLDVKGMLDQVFPIKRKMFDAAYPEFPPLVVMKYYKTGGGWITLEQFDAIKKLEKKNKKLEMEAEERDNPLHI